jgi:2-polyprenyl-3-methyl-5-hydroxy-6-metoxy-1,4-benzoquinol methylase
MRKITMPKIVKAEWANSGYVTNPLHVGLIHELMAYHCCCLECCRLCLDTFTGELKEEHKNSALHWSRCFEWPWAVINSELTRGETVLDAGGGHGVLQYALAKRCDYVVNMDMNVRSLSAAAANKERLVVPHLDLVIGDITKIPSPDENFSRVFCISVLEHMEDWAQGMNELLRVLKPGGFLMLTLDVKRNPKPEEKEFYIHEPHAIHLLETLGWKQPIPGREGLLNNYMPDGTHLNCLCLKIQK